MSDFDAIVIGAGQAGPSLAVRLANSGMRVTLIERQSFGGTCVNTGCMPTKTLIASARAAHVVRRAADFGIGLPGPFSIDYERVKERIDRVIHDARTGVERWLAGTPGISLVRGHARFEAPNVVRVGDELLRAPRIFVNVGARAHVPSFPGIEQIPYLTNTSALALTRVPEHLLVVGGSYIGLEFAQAFRRLGSDVTVIEKGDRLIAREDEDVSHAVAEILEQEGVVVRTGAERISFSRHDRGVELGISARGEAEQFVGSHALIAVGRKPNTDDLGLERAGIETDERGYLRVDDALATNVPGVWAIGDCNGRGAFTHTSYNDFEIVAANLLDGEERKVSDRVMGYALYIDPPLGRVGMTETQARATGKRVLVGRRPMKRVGRAVERDETRGFMKIVVDGDSRKILGAAILGIEGDEAIHGILDMMNAGADYDALKWAVPIHPTVSELIPTLLHELEPKG